jgi:hypothetical protein
MAADEEGVSAVPDTAPKKFVFVLMPFDTSFRDIYEVGIKPACKDAGAYCERVDEQIFHENILERVYNQIAKSDLIVADITGKNANVFYEVGYAHALNKKTILLTSDADDIPFDLKHYPHVVYEGSITNLKRELERRLAWYLSQSDKEVLDLSQSLQYFIAGQLVEEGKTVKLHADRMELWTGERCRFDMTVKNTSAKLIDVGSHRIYIIYQDSPGVTRIQLDDNKPSNLPEGGYMVWADISNALLPCLYEKLTVELQVSQNLLRPQALSIRFGVANAISSREYNLALQLP